MQVSVDAAYDSFVRTVARNRNVSLSAVRDGFGQGDMVDAGPAVAEGMADRTARSKTCCSASALTIRPAAKPAPGLRGRTRETGARPSLNIRHQAELPTMRRAWRSFVAPGYRRTHRC
jgi:ClpP class serine protease